MMDAKLPDLGVDKAGHVKAGVTTKKIFFF